MRIPFINLARHSKPSAAEFEQAFERVLRAGDFILNREVAAFEREFADFCEAVGAVGVANGTDAITLALLASNAIERGRADEIITTPLSAAYTALAIVNAGAKPVFVDLDENTLTLDPRRIEAAITNKTRAVVPVHLYGQTTEMPLVHEIAARHNLIVIEDAAQAHGARCNGEAIGARSLAATFSFYPTKNLGAFGDGGALTSNDQDFLRQARRLRQGGHYETLQADLIGLNSRLDEMQAAFLRLKLRRLAESNRRRRELARIYFERLSDLPRVRLPFVKSWSDHVFHLFVVRHERRDKLKEFLQARGVETLVHYPYLLHEQTIFRRERQKPLVVAEKIVNEILSLPLYPQMENEEIEFVCDAIAEFETR